MAQSGRERHRDRDPGRRLLADEEPVAASQLPDLAGRARADRRVPSLHRRARRALQDQQNPDNREIIRELRASADRIFDTMNGLEELP
jgi:hypothetical protein